nr:helix-turn-helix transcriptional regulator [Paenibacillus ferrarius]
MNTKNRSNIKCHLKGIMTEAKISQTRLSQMSGLCRTTISLAANERADPRLETALIISEALGIPVNEIWEFKSEEMVLSNV